jgi:cytochrome d ubiquinol oxidase subunit II
VLEERARAQARVLAPAAALAVAVFAFWTVARQADTVGTEIASAVLAALAVAFVVAGAYRVGTGAGFALSALFVELFPDAIVSSGPGPDLSLAAASSTDYTLKVMTVVAAALVPVVLAYQAWTYWVFRARLGAEDFEGVRTPVDLLARRAPARDPASPAPGSRP